MTGSGEGVTVGVRVAVGRGVGVDGRGTGVAVSVGKGAEVGVAGRGVSVGSVAGAVGGGSVGVGGKGVGDKLGVAVGMRVGEGVSVKVGRGVLVGSTTTAGGADRPQAHSGNKPTSITINHRRRLCRGMLIARCRVISWLFSRLALNMSYQRLAGMSHMVPHQLSGLVDLAGLTSSPNGPMFLAVASR